MVTRNPQLERSGAWAVSMAADAMTAELSLGGDAALRVDVTACAGAFAEAGVVIDDVMREQIGRQLEAGGERIVLEGERAADGEDGRLAWAPGMEPPDAAKPRNPDDDSANDDGEETVDFYAHSRFVNVQAGQEIVRIVPPTEGRDGRDLRGREIHAKDGEAVELEVDEQTVSRGVDGWCVARCGGVLRYDGQQLGVDERLVIDGDIDFETGSVRVECPVEIAGGIGDRFTVATTADLRVDGLIEAATVRAGGDFNANGGIAGKFRAQIDVGGNLQARYLNQVRGDVRGNLLAEREIIQCALNVGGAVRAAKATLIAGRLSVTGEAEIGTVGSDGEEPTTVELGIDRRIEACIEEAVATVRLLERQRDQGEQRRAAIMAMAQDEQRRFATELAQIDEFNRLLDQRCRHIRDRERQLSEGYRRRQTVSLRVGRMLYRRTELVTPHHRAQLRESLKGPLWIGVDERGQFIIRDERSGRGIDLKGVAKVSVRGPGRAAAASG